MKGLRKPQFPVICAVNPLVFMQLSRASNFETLDNCFSFKQLWMFLLQAFRWIGCRGVCQKFGANFADGCSKTTRIQCYARRLAWRFLETEGLKRPGDFLHQFRFDVGAAFSAYSQNTRTFFPPLSSTSTFSSFRTFSSSWPLSRERLPRSTPFE
jgi:hypothetical protein